MCSLELPDILKNTMPEVSALAKVAREHPDSTVLESCEAFSMQVDRLEKVISVAYAFIMMLAKKCENGEETAGVWRGMGEFCNTALATVGALRKQYPDCGTPQLYDRILDYKIACNERYNRIMEEIACQTTPAPKGLFPEQN